MGLGIDAFILALCSTSIPFSAYESPFPMAEAPGTPIIPRVSATALAPEIPLESRGEAITFRPILKARFMKAIRM